MSLSQYDNERLRAIEDLTRQDDPAFAARFAQGCAQLGAERCEWVLPLIAAVVFATFGITVLLLALLLATESVAIPERADGSTGSSSAPTHGELPVLP